MVDWVRSSVGLALGAAFLLVAVSIAVTLVEPGDPGPRPVLATDGDREAGDDPLLLSSLTQGHAHGIVAGTEDGRIIVLSLPIDGLRAASQVHGFNVGQYAIGHPERSDLALVAYSARSTHLGCTVGLLDEAVFLAGAYGVQGPALIDPCSQSIWDPYRLAHVRSGQPADAPLDVYRIGLEPHGADFAFVVHERIPQASNGDADRQGRASFDLAG